MKLLINEPGSDIAGAASTDAPRRYVSEITLLEARSALARIRKAKRLTPHGHRKSLALLRDTWESFFHLEVSLQVIESASDLADKHSLRAYDALHLASALLAHGEDPLRFACWDADLREAAHAEGLELVPA